MEKRRVGGRTQSSTRGCFSSFYLDWDWDPVSALGTAPVKTHRDTHAGRHACTHTHTHTTRSGGKSKGCLNSTETLQRLSESSCVEQWPQGGDYTLITTHTHTHKHNPCTLFKAPTTLALAHKCKCTRILPQMWDSGLREGITQTNREQGKASWESLERQQSHLSMARWWKERKGKEMGRKQRVEKNAA